MDIELRTEEQEEKYWFLTESPYFKYIDHEEEYHKRLVYVYEDDTSENELFEAFIYIPIAEGEAYDWTFTTYKKFIKMAIRKSEARSLPETKEWFQTLAKPIDHTVRLKKLMKKQ